MTEAERLADPDHDYELIGGHIRHAGALKAGLATLDCLLLDLTPEQAELAGLVDNQSTDMHWLDWVIAIEKLNQGPAKLKQQAIADRLGFSVGRVNNALKIAKALTPASRDLIFQQLKKLGPDKASSERPVLALASLGDPHQIKKALPVFLDRRMTEPQAQRLVNHLKEGKPLEAYNHQAASKSSQPGKTGTSSSFQPGHIPLTPVPSPEDTFNFPKHWAEMKADVKRDWGFEPTWEPYLVLFIFFGILGGIGWLGLKVIGWVIHLI
jgi:hypothetical protein